MIKILKKLLKKLLLVSNDKSEGKMFIFAIFQILMLTLKRSAPNIMRFMTCAIVLYAGFLIAGWVIIGPYSMKFRTLAESSEALFSLLNGDDMFATFYTINDSNTVIKVKIFLFFF